MKKAILHAIIGIIFFLCTSSIAFCADIGVTLEDAAGTNAFSVKDSNANEAGYIDSRGNMNARSEIQTYCTDFYSVESSRMTNPWNRTAASSGTIASVAGEASHPGIVRITSSTTANSGYAFEFGTDRADYRTVLLIAGSEYSEFVFRVLTTTGTSVRLGFQDSIISTAPVDGVWIDISGATLTGKAKNNAGPTTTGSSYSISTSTWYRGAIAVNSGATQVDFYLYTCSDGVQVWTSSLTGNIPTAAARVTSHGVVATNSGTSAVNLMDLDCMDLVIGRTMTR